MRVDDLNDHTNDEKRRSAEDGELAAIFVGQGVDNCSGYERSQLGQSNGE